MTKKLSCFFFSSLSAPLASGPRAKKQRAEPTCWDVMLLCTDTMISLSSSLNLSPPSVHLTRTRGCGLCDLMRRDVEPFKEHTRGFFVRVIGQEISTIFDQGAFSPTLTPFPRFMTQESAFSTRFSNDCQPDVNPCQPIWYPTKYIQVYDCQPVSTRCQPVSTRVNPYGTKMRLRD